MGRQKHIFWLGAIIIIFLLSRLVFIFTFPLFFDEAIYIHWAQYVASDWGWRNVSLSLDGKQPLMIWLIALSLKFIPEPIIAGRLVSVLSGLLSCVGQYFLTNKLFNRSTALFTTILYTIIPFYLIYDGLALMDGLLMTLSIYASLLTVYFATNIGVRPLFASWRTSRSDPDLTTEKKQWLTAAGLGSVIGLGLLTKSSAMFFLLFLPLGIMLFKNHSFAIYRRYFSLSLLAVVIAKAIEYVFLHPYFANITNKNHEFVKTLAEFVNTPIGTTFNQVWQINGWLMQYLGISFMGLIMVALIITPKKRPVFYLLFITLLPLVPFMLLSKQAYPRHLLFMTWPLVILASSTIIQIYEKITYKKLWAICVLLIFGAPYIFNNILLFTNPLKARLPEIEQWQFLTGEPSGWGMEQLYAFFDGRRDKKLLVLTDKPLGILPDGLAIHYFNKPQVQIVGMDRIDKEVISRFQKDYKPEVSYIILSSGELPADIHADQQLEVQRPGVRNKNWRVYRVMQ